MIVTQGPTKTPNKFNVFALKCHKTFDVAGHSLLTSPAQFGGSSPNPTSARIQIFPRPKLPQLISPPEALPLVLVGRRFGSVLQN